MFTGIIQAMGVVTNIDRQQDAFTLTIQTPDTFLNHVTIGDSICVQGICLTVTSFQKNQFVVDVSAETIRCTTFSQLKNDKRVNLEKALTLSDHLGGHLVTGHIDGIGKVGKIEKESNSTVLTISAPNDIAKYIARKGSICIDGISLTVNSIINNEFTINIIPHTYENTAILDYQIGTDVNLEIDLVARYVERLHTYK